MLASNTFVALTSLLAVSKAAYSAPSDPAAACSALASSIQIQNVTVNVASYLPAGTNLTLSQDYNLSTCARPYQIVYNDLCRVAMKVATTNRSEITLEAWLPTNWTGRFLSTGNGGTSGCIQYEDIAYGAMEGFATVGANNGHNGTSGYPFFNNPDIVADFAYRSVHTGVVVGKQVSQQYYSSTYSKSYYLGCSTGGRQGIKSVQDYPEDFDGVVAGAPAIAFNNLTSWSAHFYTLTGNVNASTYIPTTMWTGLIHSEIMKQCDGIDGVVDNILEDPSLCQFRPEALICAPGNSTNTTTCLTGTQAATVRSIFTDYYGVNGSLIYPRMQPGSEGVASSLYYGGKDFAYSTDWFRYAVYNNASWAPANYSVIDAARAASIDLSGIESFKGNLSAFKARGGRLLHYHGLQDGVISSDNSPRYYNHVSRTMNLPSAQLDDFYRFFRIAGMNHCSGGPGPWQIGQTIKGSNGLTRTPANNILKSMVAWVENGTAPDVVGGTKFINDDPAQGVLASRNHCKYPKRNVCIDAAKNATADAWTCI